jgi:uncharacterized membrane protein
MAQLFWLILGLVIFLGGHAVTRMTGLRARLAAQFGTNVYRALYSLWAVMGLAMIVHGYGVYRAAGYIAVWSPPKFLSHLAILLIWPAMIMFIAAYSPGNIKAKLKHPMLVGIKAWAFGHLLANCDLGSMLLFGAFLGWAVFARIALKKSGADAMLPAPPERAIAMRNDAIAVIGGTIITLALVFGLHMRLIGVSVL